MKKQLNEVKKLQKLAGIIGEGHYRGPSRYDEPVPFPQNGMGPDPGEPEYVDPAQEAQNILDDLSAERDPMELSGMTLEDALETVEAYGHTGPLAQEIADNLVALAGGMNERADMAADDAARSNSPKVQKAAQAISKLRQFPSFGYAELYRVLTAARLSPEEFIAAADMAGLEYETEILDNNGNAEFSIADDNYNDFRKPITWVGGKLERIDLRVREAADMATSDEITMEGDEVAEARMWFNKDGDYVEYRPEDDTAPDYDDEEDEDELPPINKAELVSFIRKAGPKPTGAKPKGEFNVSLNYIDYPSIPDSYMTGARDVFMCVVKACGGKAKLEGRPGPEQNYTVMGCSFDAIQAVWKFLASDQTYEKAGDSDTIVQANGCAQTWEINSDYDQGDEGDDEPVPPMDPNAPNFYDDPEGALKYYRSKYKY